MPQLPPADGVTQAVLNYLWDGQKCANVLHYSTPNQAVAPDPALLASRVAGQWLAGIRSQCSVTLFLSSITATDLSNDAAPGVIYTTGLPSPGTAGTPSMPNNVSTVLSLRTALRGRSFRGRIYHAGLCEGHILDNRVAAATNTALLNGYNGLKTLIGGTGEATFQLGVLSYYSQGAIRGAPLWTPVTAITTDGIVDSQRRRLPGRGT